MKAYQNGELKRKCVLIVDDVLEELLYLRIVLRREGYQVLEALDGYSALKIFNNSQPDLVLLDMRLPDLSGIEVLQKIRTTSTVPIIVISVLSEEAERVRAFDLGADMYITKPFSARTLKAYIKSILWRSAPSA
jgi:two-component system KDP operon response regulator KdpE